MTSGKKAGTLISRRERGRGGGKADSRHPIKKNSWQKEDVRLEKRQECAQERGTTNFFTELRRSKGKKVTKN